MHRHVALAALVLPFTAAAAFGQVAGQAKSNEKEVFNELIAQGKDLTDKIGHAEKVKGEIGKAELSISGKSDALKHGDEALRRFRSGLESEESGIMAKADATGCPWGSTSPDKAYVEACNAEARRLSGLLMQVKAKAITGNEFARKLAEGHAEISKATVAVFEKKKGNDNELDVLYSARSDWQKTYNAFVFDSEAYRRLKKMAPASNICAQLGNGSTLEPAVACLKKLWDGSR